MRVLSSAVFVAACFIATPTLAAEKSLGTGATLDCNNPTFASMCRLQSEMSGLESDLAKLDREITETEAEIDQLGQLNTQLDENYQKLLKVRSSASKR
jgi:peptidoglycan hydrolase CwlO-like protein